MLTNQNRKLIDTLYLQNKKRKQIRRFDRHNNVRHTATLQTRQVDRHHNFTKQNTNKANQNKTVSLQTHYVHKAKESKKRFADTFSFP